MASSDNNKSLIQILREQRNIKIWCMRNKLQYLKSDSKLFGIKYLEYCKTFNKKWMLETRGMFFSSDCLYIIRGMVPRTIEIQLIDVNGMNHVDETDDSTAKHYHNDIKLLKEHMTLPIDQAFTGKIVLNSKVDGTTLCVTCIEKKSHQYSYLTPNINELHVELEDHILLFGTQGTLMMSDLKIIDTFLSSITNVKSFDERDMLSDVLIENKLKEHMLIKIWHEFKDAIGRWFYKFLQSIITESYPTVTLAFEMILCERKTILLEYVHCEWASTWPVNDLYFLEATMVSEDNSMTYLNNINCTNNLCSIPWTKEMVNRAEIFTLLDGLQDYLLGVNTDFNLEQIHPEGFMLTIFTDNTYRTFKLKPKVYYCAHKPKKYEVWLHGLGEDKLVRLATFFPGLIDMNNEETLQYNCNELIKFVFNVIDNILDAKTVSLLDANASKGFASASAKNNINAMNGILFNNETVIRHYLDIHMKNTTDMYMTIKSIFGKTKIGACSDTSSMKRKVEEHILANTIVYGKIEI